MRWDLVTRLPLLGTTGLGAATLLASFGCSPPTAPPSHLSGTSQIDVVLGVNDRVRDIEDTDRPTLRLIHREGDPKGAVALAVFPPGGSRTTLLLAALLETRLARRGFADSVVSVHALGVVVSWEASSPELGAKFLEDTRALLLEPVSTNDPALLRAGEMLSALGKEERLPSAVDACLGVLGAEGSGVALNGPSERELERARRQSVTAGRVGLAALGSPEFLHTVSSGHDATWPRGAPPDDSWAGPEEVNVESGYPGLTLRIALRAADQEAALSAARALRSETHPIHARVAAATEELSPVGTRVTLRPRGACLAMSWVLPDGKKAPSAEMLSQAAWAGREEMHQSLQDARTEDESTLALLAPSDATEAAALAAWSAVRSPGTPGPTTAIVELRGGPEWEKKQKEFRDVFAASRAAFDQRAVPFVSRLEGGQAESWLLVASPCGTAPEAAEEAGLRALTVASVAHGLSGRSHVRLEPWISESAIGILAHAPPLRGETPEHHAARIARVAAQALSGPALDGRDVAASRADHLVRVGSDPGRALAIRVLSAPHPSFLAPLGLEQELAPLSLADVERARADLAREPLLAAFIGNSTEHQAVAAQRAFSKWLAPVRSGVTPCKEPSFQPGQGGSYTITTVDEAVEPSAVVSVPARAPRHVGRALAYLLNRPGGYLDRALLAPGLAGRAHAEWLGNETAGAVLVSVFADQKELQTATDQVRAVLDELSRGAVTSEDAAHARQVWAEQKRRIARTPRGRIVGLYLQADAQKAAEETLSRARLLELTVQLSPERHRVTIVVVRK